MRAEPGGEAFRMANRDYEHGLRQEFGPRQSTSLSFIRLTKRLASERLLD